MTDPRRFIVIDDHPLFCEALRMALSRDLGAEAVDAYPDLESALDSLDSGAPVEAALLDLNLPDVTGFDGLARLKARIPRLPVVVISALSDPRIISGAVASGAAGFIPKDTPKDELVAALQAVMNGEVYTPPGYAPPMADAPAAPAEDAAARLSQLTPQQANILGLICAGKLNKQIAYELDIAETTVKAHITSILRKLGVQSRTQAVLVAQRVQFGEILRH